MDKKEKLLTISIAAYHVEKYLAKCLESFAYRDLEEELEVLVINDGSGDAINAIAMEYVTKYPKIFHLIDKKNGGHGSTVNRGIKEANGRFFKTVDGDDLVAKEGLYHLIDLLKRTDADVVVSDYETFDDRTGQTLEHIVMSPKECISGNSYVWSDVCQKQYFVMHSITYRTSLLKENPISFSEHCFYVDAQYCLFPVPWIRKAAFLKETVYRYRLGMTTQSMDICNMQKNCAQHEKVLDSLLKCYRSYETIVDTAAKAYMQKGCAKFFVSQIKIYLSFCPDKERKQQIVKLDQKLKKEFPAIYDAVANKSVRLLRKCHYHIYTIASIACRRAYGLKGVHYDKKSDL